MEMRCESDNSSFKGSANDLQRSVLYDKTLGACKASDLKCICAQNSSEAYGLLWKKCMRNIEDRTSLSNPFPF